MTNIDIGDHVVCINGKFLPHILRLLDQVPIENNSYVVRDVLMGVHHPKVEGTVRLLLVGIVNPSPNGKAMNERGFDVRRFRKLEEIKEKAVEKKADKAPMPPLVPA